MFNLGHQMMSRRTHRVLLIQTPKCDFGIFDFFTRKTQKDAIEAGSKKDTPGVKKQR